jgi:heme/copper-type cytochrome/quinol oxidase subunit 2
LEDSRRLNAVSFATVVVALLQSLCAAVLTINGIRVGIGLAALAASSIWEPVRAFHRDAIRIPMLTLAVVGAVVNLAVLFWIWRLRARPEAQWRRREVTPKQRRSERLQVAMAVLTLVLVGLEVCIHAIVNHPPISNVQAVQSHKMGE